MMKLVRTFCDDWPEGDMILLLRFIPTAMVLVSLIAVAASGSETRYRVVDLGTLGSNVSFADDMNDHGQVVGSSGLNDTLSPRPFLYNAGITDLGSAPHQKGRALAINNRLQIVGDAQVGTPEGYDAFRAFLFEDGVLTDLGTLGGISSQARDINERGQIVGGSEFVPPPVGPWVWPAFPKIDQRKHAFIYENGVMHDLHELAGFLGEQSWATGINEHGQIIGHVDNRGFLYHDGQFVDLSTVGGVRSVPLSINNLGAVAIYVEDASRTATGFIYSNGVAAPLGSLGGGQSVPRDLNDAGVVVGQSALPDTRS